LQPICSASPHTSRPTYHAIHTQLSSALEAGKGKGQQDSGKKGGGFQDWKCRIHNTNNHTWKECPENLHSKSYKGEKQVKVEPGVSMTTLNVDGLPADLLAQLQQLQHGGA